MVITIGVAAAATILTRALPFFAFPADQPAPPYIRYLGSALPGAVFGLLVVYCLRDVDFLAGAHGAPELIGIATAGALYLWRKNMLLAIFVSTALYMVLANLVLA